MIFLFMKLEELILFWWKIYQTKPLLILNGEIFDGAKQVVVANETALVPTNSSLEIKVSCVEQGRWAYKTKSFSRGKKYV